LQTLKIGLAGLGFMGSTHLSAYSNIPDVEVTAVYSQNLARLSGDFSDVSGNLSVRPARYDFSAVRKYQDWSVLVQDPELDAIDVCLPTDLHVPVVLAALAAGKHVLCEKPMGLSAAECDRMLAARNQGNRILMIGHVLRFWPEYEYLAEFARSGVYGAILSATFIRRSGLPEWSPWLSDLSRSGGAVLDLLLHDIDQALALFGLPQRVAAKNLAGGSDAIMSTLIYPGGPEVRIQGGWFAPGTPFSMSFQIRAQRAELDWTPGGLMLNDATGQRKPVELVTRDAYQSEIGYFVDCCRSGSQPDRCPPEASALAVTVALAIRQSQLSDGAQITL
jgi:predicted dehydrogenase